MDIALMIHQLVPSAKYRGSVTSNRREDYDKLVWEDPRPKPSWEELTDEDKKPKVKTRLEELKEKSTLTSDELTEVLRIKKIL